MLTKSVIVALVLLVMVNRSLSTEWPFNRPRCRKYNCPTLPTCSYGVTSGFCGCCKVCAKGPGESCGGEWDQYGTCSEFLKCSEQRTEGICVPRLRSDTLDWCMRKYSCEDPWSCSCEDMVAKGVCTDTNLSNSCKLACGLCGDWKWILETDACIIGENNEVLDGISLDDCKVNCQDQSEFACRSLEYHLNSRRCILSEATSNSSNYRQPCPYKSSWIYTEV